MRIKNIIWDFDGVIIFSDRIREKGFITIFRDQEPSLIEKLLEYHRKNGGLSRYVKIKYFYEQLLGESIEENKINMLADEFSKVMRAEMVNADLLNADAVKFITDTQSIYVHHIASGSDGHELRYLCRQLGITTLFRSINGSPTPKIELVANILSENNYKTEDTILIGDAVNDKEAAEYNDIAFFWYNAKENICKKNYLHNFDIFIYNDTRLI